MFSGNDTLGEQRRGQCKGPYKDAEKHNLRKDILEKYPEEPPYVWETCDVNCDIDGGCTETLKFESCDCSGFSYIKQET